MTDRRPRWRIDDVLARTDLAALLDQLAEPATHTTRGRRWHCPIPDHADRHASVTMHIDHRGHERWRCWSGDDTHRGDAIDLVVATRRYSRREAIDWLANRAHMLPDQPLPPPRPKTRPASAVVPLDPAVVHYAAACERILWTAAGRPVRGWLHQRGFDDDLLRANRVGADPGRRQLRRQRGLPFGASTAAVFPALDTRGNLRYLQARYLDPRDGSKYDNPAAALGTNPRLAWTRCLQPPQPGVLLVCEGIPDALTAAGAGYQAVAILGAQAPDRTVAARLATHADRTGRTIVAVIDNDPAGRTWGENLARLVHSHAHTIAVLEPPDPGMDLNTWSLADHGWARSIDPLVQESPQPHIAATTPPSLPD